MPADEQLVDPEVSEELVGEPQEKGEEEKAPPEPEEKASAKELRQMRQELAAANQRSREAEEASRFWHDKAKTKEEPVEEPKLDEDFLEAVSSGDAKRITRTLSKLGFVRKNEVEERVSKATASMSDETRLFADFPELRKADTPFFDLTAKYHRELVADDPSLKNDPRTIRIAAKMARNEESLTVKKETSEERNKRVDAQSGDKGKPAKREGTGGTDKQDQLTAAQKSIVARFQAAGASITDEDYMKRANAGVRLSGRGR